MKRYLSLLSLAACSMLALSSCFKQEKAYPVTRPEQHGDYPVLTGGVSIGEDYETQVFYSFSTGVVASNSYRSWDICLTASGDPELWMNGGRGVLIYPAGTTDYASVGSIAGISPKAWKYDNPNGLAGQSGLGTLSDQNHLGEVLIVDDGEGLYFKVQITAVSETQYTIKTGPLEAAVGSEVTLPRDAGYNYVYYSFADGVVKPEPPKTDWDILFTRYRHIYYGYEEDGSDKPYRVNGVVANPYKTLCGEDSTKGYDFYSFGLEQAEAYKLKADRDIIGFDWKTPDINTGAYTVSARSVFVVKDQHDALWKMHFTSFYSSDGKKGNPQFELQRLQ